MKEEWEEGDQEATILPLPSQWIGELSIAGKITTG